MSSTFISAIPKIGRLTLLWLFDREMLGRGGRQVEAIFLARLHRSVCQFFFIFWSILELSSGRNALSSIFNEIKAERAFP